MSQEEEEVGAGLQDLAQNRVGWAGKGKDASFSAFQESRTAPDAKAPLVWMSRPQRCFKTRVLLRIGDPYN